MNGEDSATTSKPLEYTSGPGPPPPPARAQPLSLVLPPKKMSPPPYSVATAVHNLKGSDPVSSLSSPAQSPSSTSFTTTFLRGILSSIDSKDPVVANAWLETLMDAIDLLPTDVIRNEIVGVAVSKGQLSQPASARRSSCRLLGKIATKLDALSVRQDVLPTSLALCQDVDADVRNCMCRQLTVVAKAVGMEATKAAILPTLVELSNDESPQVRMSSLESVVQLLSVLDDEMRAHTIVPLVLKSCERSRNAEDESLPGVAHFLGRLCHGLAPNLSKENKTAFVDLFKHMATLGFRKAEPAATTTTISDVSAPTQPMPDLVPIEEDKYVLFLACRRECAFNFPAMVMFLGPEHFADALFPTFCRLTSDPHPHVRRAMAASLHELTKMIGPPFAIAKDQVCALFADDNADVLTAMISNLVHVIDALARFGVLRFAQRGAYSDRLSAALLRCEASVGATRDWRLHADCLEKLSCMANCISSDTIQQRFIPMLMNRALRARPLPCRVAAARTMLVILRFTVRRDHRASIMFRIKEDLAHARSCHSRMLFLRLCEMAMALFSFTYFKQHFFSELLCLSQDSVANVRLRLCTMLARLKAMLVMPADRALLQHLEETVKELMAREQDRDVLNALQTAIEELERTDMLSEGFGAEDDSENERKLREERLIYSMEEQMSKIQCLQDQGAALDSEGKEEPFLSLLAPDSSVQMQAAVGSSGRRRSESLPPPLSRTPREGALAQDLTRCRLSSPEPSRTYSPETLVPFLDSTGSTQLAPWEPYYERTSSAPAFASRFVNLTHLSASMDSLDPSAKEFMVDAGVSLESVATLPSASSTSLPNLSKISTGDRPFDGSGVGKSSISNASSLPTLDRDLSDFLISNAEMQQFEAEYERIAAASAQSSKPQQPQQPDQPRRSAHESRLKPPSNASRSTAAPLVNGHASARRTTENNSSSVGKFSVSTSSLAHKPQLQKQQEMSSSTSTPPTTSGAPTPPLPTAASSPSPASALPRLTLTSRLSGSTERIQGSIERLSEKWEAKRRNLMSASASDAKAESGETSKPAAVSAAPQAQLLRRPVASTSKLGVPRATAQKRLSLSDHESRASGIATRTGVTNRKSLNADSSSGGDKQDRFDPSSARLPAEPLSTPESDAVRSSSENHFWPSNSRAPAALPQRQSPSPSPSVNYSTEAGHIIDATTASPVSKAASAVELLSQHRQFGQASSFDQQDGFSQLRSQRQQGVPRRQPPPPPRNGASPDPRGNRSSAFRGPPSAASPAFPSRLSLPTSGYDNAISAASAAASPRQIPPPLARGSLPSHSDSSKSLPSSSSSAPRRSEQQQMATSASAHRFMHDHANTIVVDGQSQEHLHTSLSVSEPRAEDRRFQQQQQSHAVGNLNYFGSNSGSAPPSGWQHEKAEAASSFVPKYTRVPPPRYRPHPPQHLRRPLSQQDDAHQRLGQRRQHHLLPAQDGYAKSLSVENILFDEAFAQLDPAQGQRLSSSDGNSGSSRSSSPNSGESGDFSSGEGVAKASSLTSLSHRIGGGTRTWQHQPQPQPQPRNNRQPVEHHRLVPPSSSMRPLSAPEAQKLSPAISNSKLARSASPSRLGAANSYLKPPSSSMSLATAPLRAKPQQTKPSSVSNRASLGWSSSQLSVSGVPRPGGRSASSAHSSPGSSRPGSPPGQHDRHLRRLSSNFTPGAANGQARQMSYPSQPHRLPRYQKQQQQPQSAQPRNHYQSQPHLYMQQAQSSATPPSAQLVRLSSSDKSGFGSPSGVRIRVDSPQVPKEPAPVAGARPAGGGAAVGLPAPGFLSARTRNFMQRTV